MFVIKAALLVFTCTVAEGALKCTATNGMECEFPFKRPGSPKVYTEPAPSVSSGKHWCATKTKADQSYDTWSYCRKDDCDVETVDELFERIRPKDECLTCITENNAPNCVRPCVTNPNKLACFNCLLESNALICRLPCVGDRTGDPTEMIVGNITGTSCKSTSSGPYGSFRRPPHGFAFSDSGAATQGNITQISFRAGEVIDQIQVTYGNTAGPLHGGSGGIAPTPYTPKGKIVKVEIYVWKGSFPTYVQALRFTTDEGQVSNWFGPPNDGTANYLVIDKTSSGCHLQYLDGYTTGNNALTKSNYVNRLTFFWKCC